MAKINLLPWREEQRKLQQQEFLIAIGMGVLATCLLFGIVYLYIDSMKEYQESRNRLLKEEIRLVDKKIKEVKDIEAKKNQLLIKIEVIQELQESRPQIVHLFDELAIATPEGIFLSKFKQTGKDLNFDGKAQSSARVSAYMRGIEQSSWLNSPVLKIIQSSTKPKEGSLNEFTLRAKQGVKKPKDLGGKK